MLRFCGILYLILFSLGFSKAQSSSTDPMFEAQTLGGKLQIDQVIETQMSLPKQLLGGNFRSDFVCFFDLDSLGRAQNIKFDGQVPVLLSKEMQRLFPFYHFKLTLNLPNESRPYFLKFSLSSDKYKNYIKQKTKFNLKLTEPADSDLVVHSKADRSPQFWKDGEEGLNEYILSQIEYPRTAVERSIEGTVVLEFVVETNGFVTGIEVKKGVNAGCTEEALRLIRLSRWKPALIGGRLVRYRMTCPIVFSLRNINKSYESSNSTIGQ